MISIRVPGMKSWFDNKSVPFLSWQLCENLKQRMNGRKGLFVTLTYRRDEYESPSDLFDQMKQRQDVPLFIRRLNKYLGISLKGKWMRKMEFQRGGWIHFHLVIDYPHTIPHTDLLRLWGYGHVWVERWSENHTQYLAKYISKGETVPGWILMEKPKTIKIVAVSPGFWGKNTDDKKKYIKKIPNPWGKSGCCIPIGVRLEEYNNRTLCRTKEKEPAPSHCQAKEKEKEKEPAPSHGRTKVRGYVPSYFTVDVHIGFVLQACLKHGIEVSGGDEGWLNLDIDRDDFMFIASAAADAAAIHLINRRKPDRWPRWINIILESVLDEQKYLEAG